MAEVGLSDVMDHLAIAFGGIYEKLTERDFEVDWLRERINAQDEAIEALSNRIEGMHRKIDSRTGHVA